MRTLSNEAKAIEALFQISNKEGARVPYELNPAQRFFDNHDTPNGPTKILIAKARQKGFSSIILAKMGIRCLGREGTRAVCISHESHATQRLLDKVDYYIRHLKGPKPVFGRHSRTEMYFPKTEGSYYIGTAGAKAFGRGDTITDLHCSEYAFWENPTVHFAGLFQAVPKTGRIYIESTGNGRNNDFYFLWQNAPAMGYLQLFYPWHADDEYTEPLPNNMLEWKPNTPRFNSYLLELKHKHKLSDEKMYWYELKLRSLREDIAQMQQEYPSEPEECFQATGGSIFGNVPLTNSHWWQPHNYQGFYCAKHAEHPRPGFNYVIGADPSGGTGNDDAAFQIFCIETYEQVFEFASNRCNPYTFAQLLCDIGATYNTAFVVTEANNHGAAVVPYLKQHYPNTRIYKRKMGTRTTPATYGWMNSEITKHAMVGLMQEMIDQTTFYGIQTVKELQSFEEDQEGRMGARSDNLVIATGLAMIGLQKFEYMRKQALAPPKVEEVKAPQSYMTYTLEDVLSRIKKPSSSLAQVGRGYPNG